MLYPSLGVDDFEVVMAIDLSQCRPPSEPIIKELFDLSPNEARICVLLGQGLTVVEVAEELLVKASTVRVHLKSIFEKVGVHGRQDLIRVLNALHSYSRAIEGDNPRKCDGPLRSVK